MLIAVMVPMDEEALSGGAPWPSAWSSDDKGVYGFEFPEVGEGGPRLCQDIAAYVEEHVLGFMAVGHERMFLQTRSEAALCRVRRMVAERDDLRAEVYLVRGEEQERHEVNQYGAICPWPRGLFEHGGDEAEAILRAATAKKRRGATGHCAARKTTG